MDKDIVTVKELNRDRSPGFMTFSMPYDQETAELQFESRYGYSPEKVWYFNDKYLMLGPVVELEVSDDG